MKLPEKVAVVTGAGRGLGRATALAMAAQGANLSIISRSGEELQAVADDIRKSGREVLALEGDVSDRKRVAKIIEETVTRFSTVDILVNNAAVIGPAAFMAQANPQAWQQTLDINLTGCYHFCRGVIPVMQDNHRGKIINVVSGLGMRPFPRFCAYAVSKSGLIQLTRSLAEELRHENIQVNALDPGVMDTRMQFEIRNLDKRMISEDLHQRFTGLHENKQLKDPAEVARVMVALVSPEADHLNGRIIRSSEFRVEDD